MRCLVSIALVSSSLAAACEAAPPDRASPDVVDAPPPRRSPAGTENGHDLLAVDVPVDSGPPDAALVDVSSNDAHAPDIDWLVAQEIVTLCAPRRFCPDEPIRRRDAVVWVVRAMHGASFSFDPTPRFVDVSASDEWFPHVQKANAAGIVAGHHDGSFRPDDPMPRATAAVLVVRGTEPHDFPFRPEPYFTDVSSSQWAFPDVQRARDRGLLPADASVFRPDAKTTRGELAGFLRAALRSAWPPRSG